MARSFGAASDQVAYNHALPTTTGTVALWFRPNWAQTDNADHVMFDGRVTGDYFRIQKWTDNKLYVGWFNGLLAIASGSYTINQNAWNSIIIVWSDLSNVLTCYLNGTQIGQLTSAFTTSTLTSERIGNYDSDYQSQVDFDGRIAEFVVWGVELNANDIASYHKGCLAWDIRRSSLRDYFPLEGIASPEPNYGSTPSASGTLTGTARANHAPVVLFRVTGWGSYEQTPAKATFSNSITLTPSFAPAPVIVSAFTGMLGTGISRLGNIILAFDSTLATEFSSSLTLTPTWLLSKSRVSFDSTITLTPTLFPTRVGAFFDSSLTLTSTLFPLRVGVFFSSSFTLTPVFFPETIGASFNSAFTLTDEFTLESVTTQIYEGSGSLTGGFQVMGGL